MHTSPTLPEKLEKPDHDYLDGRVLRIGTRGSQMALAQTNLVVEDLKKKLPNLKTEIVVILTSGDWKPSHGETRLMESKGGKGLFAHEIEERILAGEVDCGVHSLKDMPSRLPEGLEIKHFIARGDARDAFVSKKYARLEDMLPGSVLGTSSLRRKAFLLAKFPHLKVVPLRGNTPTRIEKMDQGQVDATFLGVAGLYRVGLQHRINYILEPDFFLPACGQGTIGIEIPTSRPDVAAIFDHINCPETFLISIAERTSLQVLDGSCHTPIGAFAQIENGRMTLRVAVAEEDGSAFFADHIEGPVSSFEDAHLMGKIIGLRLKPRLPTGIL